MVLEGHMADVPEWLQWASAASEREGQGPPKHSGRAAAVEGKLRVWQLRKGGSLSGSYRLGADSNKTSTCSPTSRTPSSQTPRICFFQSYSFSPRGSPGEDGILHPKPFIPRLQLRT